MSDYRDDPPCWVTNDHEGLTPHCPRCGFVNYAWMGYLGARRRWAKVKGVSEEEIEAQWEARAVAEYQQANPGEGYQPSLAE